MATKFNLEHTFPKSVDAVFALYNTQAFFENKYAAAGCTNIEVLSFSSTAQGLAITCRYDAKSDVKLPDFVKKFVPEVSSITQTDTWDAHTKTGKIAIEIKGAPVKVSAEMKLVATGNGGCKNTMTWTVNSSIPLVGGKLEGVLADDIKGKSSRDEMISNQLLAKN